MPSTTVLWHQAPLGAVAPRILLRLARDHMRALDVADVYYLEATGETTPVRTRSARDARLGRIHPTNAFLTRELLAKTELGIDFDEKPRWG